MTKLKTPLSHLISLIWLTCLLATQVTQAKEPIWLTSTNKHGDCVSLNIDTPKTNFERNHMDKTYCAENNTGDAASMDACLKHLNQQQTSRSFVHFCGDGVPYIGINGKTYALNRVGKAPTQHPYLVGRYAGKNAAGQPLQVEVRQIRLLTKTYQDDTSTADDNILDYKSEVELTIKSGSK